MSQALPVSLWPDPDALGPITDLYQLTMMAGYRALGKENQRATFELFVRKPPPNRSCLILAGLEQSIGDLLRLRFSAEQVEQIRGLKAFSRTDPTFFEWLKDLRFEGDIHAIAEGSVVFPGEPLIRVEAPLAQAQWVETFLLASIGYATLVASKAARVVQAAGARPVYDFGARRAPGPQSGLIAARSAYLAGCAGTSHVEAALRLGIPCSGTMAHSWVQSFPSESDAFAAYARVFPGGATLLVDTYDTLEGVARAAAIEPPVEAVRIDSGDLGELAQQAREYLDQHGRMSVRIVVSGDLDEHSIAELVGRGAPIDGFGVGTEMATSRDAPALAIVYKLVALEGAGRMKRSPGKRTYPLPKQVFRQRDLQGHFVSDLVTRWDEPADGEALLLPIVEHGRLVRPLPSLEAVRAHCQEQLAALSHWLRPRDANASYPVTYSPTLEVEARRLGL